MIIFLLSFVTACFISADAVSAEMINYQECTNSIIEFLDDSTGIFTVPKNKEIDGKNIVHAQAIVDFRESHGAYQSNFGFENVKTKERIELFREVRRSDKEERGNDDWAGTVKGGILGGAAASRKISLALGEQYRMIIWGENNPPHKEDARSAKTNINDPVSDNNDEVFTFYVKRGMIESIVKSIPFINKKGSSVSTIVGFEDGWLHAAADYNDVVVEICLVLN